MRHTSSRTSRLAALLAALALCTAGPALAAPALPSKQYTIEQFMDTLRITGASFSPDESRILFSSNQSGIFNAYTVPVTGGTPTPLTQSTTDTTFAVSYFPKDERILYTRDQSGNELNHLYVRLQDGKEKDLTPGEKLKAMFAGWKHDLAGFYVMTNERDNKFFDLYEYDAKSYDRTMIYKDETGYQIGAISDDGKWLALGKTEGTADSDIYLYDTASRQMKKISEHTGQVEFEADEFDPTSKYLYFRTNNGGEFMRVCRYELGSGKVEDVEKADWDIAATGFSYNGKYRFSATNADGSTVVRIYNHATGAPVDLPKLPDGDITNFSVSRSETKMAFYVNGDRSPNNLHVYDFGKRTVTKLSDSMTKQIDQDDLVEAQVVRFKSFDGVEIPNIYYKPHQATAAIKSPALVWVHGGPGGQTRRGYSALMQYLVNHGYVVLGINNRGSSGYGKTFFTADDGKHGKEPLWDCVEGRKYLASLPYVDANRIGIIGGSYGGYMVLAAMAYQPDVFNVGVDIFGVSNWVRTLQNIPPWWESFKVALYQEIGDPTKELDKLKETSPLFAADRIKKPLIVLQGANDPRVIKPESDDIVAAVRKNNVPVEYVVFPDEGHGFTKKKNEIQGYSAILKFLDQHLKGEPAPPTGM